MNYIQLILFSAYVCSVLVCGIAIYRFLAQREEPLNKFIYLGESLLLGSIFVSAELLLLSLLGLYKAPYLWAGVFLNFIAAFDKNVRKAASVLFSGIKPNFGDLLFFVLISVFIFRNCFFLVDVDSHSVYLFAQKLWLEAGTSITGGAASDMRIFVPHFDALPYGLGLSLFGQETLFPQLINLFWRLIAIVLIFGYAAYRFNRYAGLAAAMLVLFDLHFFYSGANRWVVINGALIALLFAAAYNFWESRIKKSDFRLLLGFIFTAQLLANKYQMIFTAVFLTILGVLVQGRKFKVRLLPFGINGLIMLLWYIKNFIVTGLPTFPLLAGKFHIFGQTAQQADVFVRVFGGIKPQLFIKYLSYLFVWPGINAAKFIVLFISFLPLIIIILNLRNKDNWDFILELSYWLGLSVLTIMGICLSCHQDPRYYRFPVGIMAFSVIFAVYYLINNLIGLKNKFITAVIIVGISLPGYKIVYQTGGDFRLPTLRENVGVLTDKLHMDYFILMYFPQVVLIQESLKENRAKVDSAAWGAADRLIFPSFLLPVRPMASLWLTTLVKWDSYVSQELILRDLREQGIEWVMEFKDSKLLFTPAADYAKEAVKFKRFPAKTSFDYNFPAELSIVNYGHKLF